VVYLRKNVARLALPAAAVVLIFACGPIESKLGSPAPQNRCPAFACKAYSGVATTCESSSGACVASSAPPFWLVVNLPRTSFFAAESTFVFPAGTLKENLKASLQCTLDRCFIPPHLTVRSARYVVPPELAPIVGRSLSPGAESVALPIQAKWTPLVSVEGRSVPAYLLGLPYEPFVANVISYDDTLKGPGGTDAATMRAILTPMNYQLSIEPEGQLAELYPPYISEETVPRVNRLTISPTEALQLAPKDLDPEVDRTLRLTASNGRDLSNFRAFIRRRDTKARVSTVVTLQGTAPVAVLNTRALSASFEAPTTPFELVVEPPEGELGIPRLEVPLLLTGVFPRRFPELPYPTTVVGRVLSRSGLPVRSTVAFFSEQVKTTFANTFAENLLRYEALVSTDGQGVFATVLPPGTYRTVVTPDASASGSLARTTTLVTIDKKGLLFLTANERVHVEGTVLLADGRSLADADIKITPSTKLLARSADDRERWPKDRYPRPPEAAIRTNQSGYWVSDLDEGEYDVTVEPARGTGFPSAVRSIRVCAKDRASGDPSCSRADTTQFLQTITVSPPVHVNFRMIDPTGDGNPLSGALVRSFEFRDGAFVQTGATTASESGDVDLLMEPLR
jgi:hypothetical protein